jgi:hydroxylamine reductase
MQDTLSHVVKSVSLWANSARETGATEEQLHAANIWTLRAVFSTLTNVNFSEERIAAYIQEGLVIKKDLEKLAVSSTIRPVGPVAETALLGKSLQDFEEFGHTVSIPKRMAAMGDEDCFSLSEIATYGARGTFCMVHPDGCKSWFVTLY